MHNRLGLAGAGKHIGIAINYTHEVAIYRTDLYHKYTLHSHA